MKVCFLSLDFYGAWKPDFVTPKQIFAGVELARTELVAGDQRDAESDLTGRKAGSPGTLKSAQWVPFVGGLS